MDKNISAAGVVNGE